MAAIVANDTTIPKDQKLSEQQTVVNMEAATPAKPPTPDIKRLWYKKNRSTEEMEIKRSIQAKLY
jgi:hypothetical protein